MADKKRPEPGGGVGSGLKVPEGTANKISSGATFVKAKFVVSKNKSAASGGPGDGTIK